MAYTNWGHYAYNEVTGQFDIWVQTVVGSTSPLPGETRDEYEARMQALLGNNLQLMSDVSNGGYSIDSLLAYGFQIMAGESQQDFVIRVNNMIDTAFQQYGGFTAPIGMAVYQPAGWSWVDPTSGFPFMKFAPVILGGLLLFGFVRARRRNA